MWRRVELRGCPGQGSCAVSFGIRVCRSPLILDTLAAYLVDDRRGARESLGTTHLGCTACGVGGATRGDRHPRRVDGAGRPRHRHDAPGLRRHAARPRAGRGLDRHRRAGHLLFLGLSVGQLVYGPVSDRYAGARRSTPATSSTRSGRSPGRWRQPRPALGGPLRVGPGGCRSAGGDLAVIRDSYSGDAMARAMSFVMAIFVLAPILAPSLGYAVIAVVSWRVAVRGLRGRGGPPWRGWVRRLPNLAPRVPARAERRPHRPRRPHGGVRPPGVRLHGGDRPPLRRLHRLHRLVGGDRRGGVPPERPVPADLRRAGRRGRRVRCW